MRRAIGVAVLNSEDMRYVDPPADGAAWFHAAGIGPAPEGGARFSQGDHALDAAIAGAGVALGRLTLAHDALKDGTLVAPFPLALRMPAQYRFVCQKGAETLPAVAAFEAWLLQGMNSVHDMNHDRTFADAPRIDR